jgi:hypothetical protein
MRACYEPTLVNNHYENSGITFLVTSPNFRNIIHKTPLLDFSKYTEKDEHPTVGIQWHGGIGGPSWLFGCPHQTYWSAFYFILMFGRKRFVISILGKKMPYRNYNEFRTWDKERRTES